MDESYCNAGHPAHDARWGCGPCRDEKLAKVIRLPYDQDREPMPERTRTIQEAALAPGADPFLGVE